MYIQRALILCLCIHTISELKCTRCLLLVVVALRSKGRPDSLDKILIGIRGMKLNHLYVTTAAALIADKVLC